MKLLFLTDTHHRGTTPQNRLDNFPATQRAKLQEVLGLVERHGVDFVLHGGDFWDTPFPALNVCGEVLEVYQNCKAPIYAIAGNHDLYGHNLQTLPRTMLGFLARLGVINLLAPGEVICLKKDGLQVQLTGQSFHHELDRRDPVLDYCVAKGPCDFAIHMVHGLLAHQSLGEVIRHTAVDRIVETEADLTLVGHYHLGFPALEVNGRHFLNPGALVRVNNHPTEMARRPQVLLIDLSGGDITYDFIPLTAALPGEAVLDRSQVEAQVAREERLAQFVQEVTVAGEYHGLSIEEMLGEIAAKETLPAAVREEALRRIGLAQERLLAGEVQQ